MRIQHDINLHNSEKMLVNASRMEVVVTRPTTFERRHHSPPYNIPPYNVPLHGDYIQMSFFLGTPKTKTFVVPKL
jgi:hypothetical protein